MIEYELEALKWKKRQLALRRRYADTPPGLAENVIEGAEERLAAEWKEYEEHHQFCLNSAVQIREEPFVGRQEELKEIRRRFSEGFQTVFLSGMGGIGKSALARVYARMYGGEYDMVLFWSYEKSLEQIFADDGQLGISNLAYTQSRYFSRRRYAREKYEKLLHIAGSGRLLIILDNFNQTEDSWFADFEKLPCDRLITTRLSGSFLSERGAQVIPVGPFLKEEEWKEFYRVYTGMEPEGKRWEKLNRDRDRMQNHTLKMKLAISNPEQKWTDEQLARSILSNYRLKKSQIQILCELSYLTLLGIPREVYLSCTEEKEEDLDHLKTWSLVQERSDALGRIFVSLHPVIAEAVRTTWRLALTRCLRFVEKFSEYARFSYYRVREGELWLMPQVFAVLDRIPEPVAWRHNLYMCLAGYFMVWECFDESEKLLLPLYACMKEYYGEYHQFTAFIALRTAALYHNSLRPQESRGWYMKSVEIYRAAKPVSRIFYHDKAEACSKLARTYELEKDYEAAHRLLDEAMAAMTVFRRETEYADPKLWELRRGRFTYVYLRRATLYFKQGELKRAQQELDTGLGLFPLHEFERLEYQRLQARIYLAQGEYERAREAAERDLETCIRYHGESVKMALTCREILGDVYDALGELQAADGEYSRTLVILQEKYPGQVQWMNRLQKKLARGAFE